jgi:Ser/Thr protein kinase RdoA (MazF antagonist)
MGLSFAYACVADTTIAIARKRARRPGQSVSTVRHWLQRVGSEGSRDAERRIAELAALIDEMVALASPPGAALPTGLCHGDVRLVNVRFDGVQPTLFDLECCGAGACVCDLACYWRWRVGLGPTDDEPSRAEWQALLRGYEQVRALAPAELRRSRPWRRFALW